jgi:hypothetical protein
MKPQTQWAATLCGLALSSACLAGNVNATAYQNLISIQETTSPGNSTAAAVNAQQGEGYARVTTGRRAVESDILGYGATATTHLTTTGFGSTNYELWNQSENRKLTAPEAEPLKLSFNFKLTGFLETEPISLSGSSVSFQAVVYSDLYDEVGSGATLVFGPGPGGNQYLQTGDGSLVGSVNKTFSLVHRNDDSGMYTMQLISGANNRARAQFQFSLESVSLLAGAVAASPSSTFNAVNATAATAALGIRLVETGEITPVGAVTAVPEPSSLVMMTAGLGLLAAVRARRRGIATEGSGLGAPSSAPYSEQVPGAEGRVRAPLWVGTMGRIK